MKFYILTLLIFISGHAVNSKSIAEMIDYNDSMDNVIENFSSIIDETSDQNIKNPKLVKRAFIVMKSVNDAIFAIPTLLSPYVIANIVFYVIIVTFISIYSCIKIVRFCCCK